MNIARDAEPWTVHSNGGDWSIAWHPPSAVPPGTAHGANAFCLTADRGVILISGDGERWGWPGGRLLTHHLHTVALDQKRAVLTHVLTARGRESSARLLQDHERLGSRR